MAKRFIYLINLYHRLYRITGAYKYIKENTLKLLLSIVAVIGLVMTLNYFFDIQGIIEQLTRRWPTEGILGLFLLSESTLGVVTPEFLMVWAKEMDSPWWMLFALATLSFFSGFIAYGIGKFLSSFPVVQKRFMKRYSTMLEQLKKFGAIVVALGALTPLPFPVICQLAGIVKFPMRAFAGIILLRYVRFAIYGVLIFNIL